MKGTFVILAFFTIGVLLSVSGQLPDKLISTDWSTYVLYLLMFLAGIGIGADRKSWAIIRAINFKIFLVPAGIVAGTFLGASICSILLPSLSLKEVLAVSAGFGYYSLSSVFISELHSEAIGVIALLSNIFREIATLLFTPIFVKYFGKLAGIASGGATSMDTTLPIISKFSGREYAIISVFSGMVLTIIVPLVVTFILTFGK